MHVAMDFPADESVWFLMLILRLPCNFIRKLLEVVLSVYREVESHNMTLRLSAPT